MQHKTQSLQWRKPSTWRFVLDDRTDLKISHEADKKWWCASQGMSNIHPALSSRVDYVILGSLSSNLSYFVMTAILSCKRNLCQKKIDSGRASETWKWDKNTLDDNKTFFCREFSVWNDAELNPQVWTLSNLFEVNYCKSSTMSPWFCDQCFSIQLSTFFRGNWKIHSDNSSCFICTKIIQ